MPALQELLQKADSYKQKIASARPPAKEELKSLDNYFRIGFTYASNALEGNDYINALSASRRLDDMEPFAKLIAECVIETERDYCRLLKL